MENHRAEVEVANNSEVDHTAAAHSLSNKHLENPADTVNNLSAHEQVEQVHQASPCPYVQLEEVVM